MRYKNLKEYPEWTVPEEVCRVGKFRADCPYATPEKEEYNKARVVEENIEFNKI